MNSLIFISSLLASAILLTMVAIISTVQQQAFATTTNDANVCMTPAQTTPVALFEVEDTMSDAAILVEEGKTTELADEILASALAGLDRGCETICKGCDNTGDPKLCRLCERCKEWTDEVTASSPSNP